MGPALFVIGIIGASELVTFLVLKGFGVWHSVGIEGMESVTSSRWFPRVDCGKDLQYGE